MFSHIDADAFFASVLVRKYPHLRGKPLLALGMGGGCVIAASYEAKACGVRTGMRFREAQALCPGALSMPSDFHEAARASQEIEDILRNTCPFIEQMSVDEWYMDLRGLVGGMPSSLGYWGEEMQTQILRKTGLSVSVGIAETKLLAKMAGEFRKPAGVTVIPVSTCSGKLDVCRQEFLAQRPAAAIPGIGRKRVRHTDQRG
jgi:DNA polymerase-4